jgi:hypothetical protein
MQSTTPSIAALNEDPWNLNIETPLSFQWRRHAPVYISISKQKSKNDQPTQRVLNAAITSVARRQNTSCP